MKRIVVEVDDSYIPEKDDELDDVTDALCAAGIPAYLYWAEDQEGTSVHPGPCEIK